VSARSRGEREKVRAWVTVTLSSADTQSQEEYRQRHRRGKGVSVCRALGHLACSDGAHPLQHPHTALSRYMSLGNAFYRGADAVILVYDVTNKRSFDNLQNWMQEFLVQGVFDSPTFPFIVVANKVDREDKRVVGFRVSPLCCCSGAAHAL
jgi:GTPase SAR1 family protein